MSYAERKLLEIKLVLEKYEFDKQFISGTQDDVTFKSRRAASYLADIAKLIITEVKND